MTTAMLNTYYCTFCAAVAKFANKTFTAIVNTFEAIGTARAASQLAQMGYHDLAKNLMLQGTESVAARKALKNV
jgi:hypothetical protein